MDKKEHAILLRNFLTALFDEDDTVYIFPCLSKEKMQAVIDGKASLPTTLHHRVLVYSPKSRSDNGHQWNESELAELKSKCLDIIPRQVLDPFTRRAGSTSTQIISKLWDFVALGYDIYFCCNPLTFGQRSQKTVRKACHIVLESDDTSTPIQVQKAIFENFENNISAMVFSGNKSVHAFVRLSPPIWNNNPIRWETRHRLRMADINGEADWSIYKDVAAHWIKKIEEHGLKLDTQVSMDCSRLTRLPGFNHSKTGKPSEVLCLNPASSYDWYWETDMAFSFDNAKRSSTIGTPGSLDQTLSIIGSIPSHLPIPSQLSQPTGISHNIVNSQEYLDCLEEREKRRRGTSKTNVIHFRSNKTDKTFLDDLKEYEKLKYKGIPNRHVRRDLHKVMFTKARIFNLTEYQMAEEWRRILEIHPENIGCSIDEGVGELQAAFHTHKDFRLFLPDTTSLPHLNRKMAMNLREWLVTEKCPCTKDILKIIKNILWDYIRTLPLQCARGQIGLKSSVLQRTCRGKGGYKAALAWSEEQNILKMTDADYAAGIKTRKYFVNIPLILHHLGFETADLDWSQTLKQEQEQAELQAVG